MVRFQYKAIVKESWVKTRENYGRILVSLGAFFFIVVFFSQIMKATQGSGALGFLITVLNQALAVFLSIGLIRCFLQAVDGKKVIFSTLFSGSDVFLTFLTVHIAYMLLCLLGLILFIVPGLIWMYKYSFASYFIADQKTGVREAFSKSGQITHGYKWHLFLLGAVSIAINIGGLLCFGIGLLVTFPLTCMFYPVVFRMLTHERAGESCQNAAF